MRQRWPNTAHWQRVVSTFRATDETRWRTAAAALLGCEKRALRGMVDRDLPPVEIKALDAALIERLHSNAARLQERAENVCNIARSVMRATNEISRTEIERPVIFDADSEPFDVKTAHFEPWEAIIREILTEDA